MIPASSPTEENASASLSNQGPRLLAGCVIVALAVLVATWWLVGPLDEPGGWGSILKPPDVPTGLEVACGVVALVVIGVACLWFIAKHRSQRLQRGWPTVAALLALASFMIGGILRVVTARTVGANIGGGFLIIFGSPFVGICLAAAILKSVRLLRGAPRPSH